MLDYFAVSESFLFAAISNIIAIHIKTSYVFKAFSYFTYRKNPYLQHCYECNNWKILQVCQNFLSDWFCIIWYSAAYLFPINFWQFRQKVQFTGKILEKCSSGDTTSFSVGFLYAPPGPLFPFFVAFFTFFREVLIK